MKYVLFALLLVASCKPLVKRPPQTDEATFGCVTQALLEQMVTAEAAGDTNAVQNLSRNGCFALPPRLEVKVLRSEGDFVFVDIHKLGLMRMTPGLEKIKSIRAWVHKPHLTGL